MNFTLHLPNDYQRQPLPGLDEWCADLRANPDKQLTGRLGLPDGPNCCLGRYCILQGRLDGSGVDISDDGDSGTSDVFSERNPIVDFLKQSGDFPAGVYVEIETKTGNGVTNDDCLAECNDHGLTFAQIATIIENVWYNSGPILK